MIIPYRDRAAGAMNPTPRQEIAIRTYEEGGEFTLEDVVVESNGDIHMTVIIAGTAFDRWVQPNGSIVLPQ